MEETLKRLGFSDKEVLVYLCILERGKASAALISQFTKINRTTIYSVTKELIEKGVIAEELGGTNRYFTVLSPEDLRNTYAEEEAQLKKKKKNVEQAIVELAELPKSQRYSIPKTRFVDERHLTDFLYKQLPVWIESADKYPDKNMYGFQDPSLLEAYPEWVEFFWQTFPKDSSMHMFTNQKPAEKDASQKYASDRRRVTYWNKAGEFSATHAVIGDYVLFLMTKEHPFYLVEINDAVMAENSRQMFKSVCEEISEK